MPGASLPMPGGPCLLLYAPALSLTAIARTFPGQAGVLRTPPLFVQHGGLDKAGQTRTNQANKC